MSACLLCFTTLPRIVNTLVVVDAVLYSRDRRNWICFSSTVRRSAMTANEFGSSTCEV